jgi:2-dehydropantoate 2-reductase
LKILVYGAGVLGSLYAARLHAAGHDVSLVARGDRLSAIRDHGILLAEGSSSVIRSVPVHALEHPTGSYDLIAVFVRSHQLAAVLNSVAGIGGDVLFLLNWAAGTDPLIAALGRDRVLLGFPNQGGTMDGDVVRYRKTSLLTRFVSMPIGETDGRASERVEKIAETFSSAGFAAKAEPRMDAWLETHAAFEVPLGLAVHAAGGLESLAGDSAAIRTMIRQMRHNLTALDARPVPSAFTALRTVPEAILVPVFRAFLRSTAAEPLSTATDGATAELQLLAEQLRGRADARQAR